MFSLLWLGTVMWVLIAIAVVAFVIYFWGIISVIGLLIIKTLWLIISIPMQLLGKKSKQGLNKVNTKLKSANKRFK